jgi:hypothetical protein
VLRSDVANIETQSKTSSVKAENASEKLRQHPKAIIGAMIAVVCVIVVAVIAISSGKCEASGCNNKTVSGSDYCYSHKCALSSCDNMRYSYSNYCFSHYLLYDDDATTTNNQVYSYELKISNVTLTSNSSYTVAEGTITNNSDQTVSFVKIKGSFETKSGTVVDTDWTYAVGSEGLDPGESCKWRMSVSKDSSIKSCDVTVFDFDY